MAKVRGVFQASRDENIQDDRICLKHTTMKPIGSLRNGGTSDKPRFSVHFDDGMTIILHTVGVDLVYENMLSVGVDSYYLKKGKWPTGKNLEKRVDMAIAYVGKNIKRNRYKKK